MGTFFLAKELAFAGIILAISFFVLLGARKADSKGLKVFGYIIAILLWISIALSVIMISAKSPMKPCMPEMKGQPGMYHKKKKMMMHKKGKGKEKMMRKEKMPKEKQK